MVYEAVWNDGVKIRVRDLTFIEHRRFWLSDLPIATRNLKVYELALVDGPSSNQVPAGIAAWVGYNLIESSPFTGKINLLQQSLQISRDWLQSSYVESARALIAGTFHTSFDELDKMDVQTFFKRLAAAEFLVGNRMEPADLSKPQDPQKTRQDAKRAKADMIRKSVEERRESWNR